MPVSTKKRFQKFLKSVRIVWWIATVNGGKDLWNKYVLSAEWKSEWTVEET